MTFKIRYNASPFDPNDARDARSERVACWWCPGPAWVAQFPRHQRESGRRQTRLRG